VEACSAAGADIIALDATEQRLASYILQHAEAILYLTVHQLTECAGTSAGTVVRFCQRLGYAGFAQFKLVLAADLVAPVRTMIGEIEPDDDLGTVAQKIAAAIRQAIADTMRGFDSAVMEQVVRAVAAADRLGFIAVGASGRRQVQVHAHRHARRCRRRSTRADDVRGDVGAVRYGGGHYLFGRHQGHRGGRARRAEGLG
jgi:DNA-binding MurR/RpiR family transcriptional regulator